VYVTRTLILYLTIPHQRDCKWILVEANIALGAELAIACGYLRPCQPRTKPHRTDPPLSTLIATDYYFVTMFAVFLHILFSIH
jgi:hypothetical protein